MEDTKCGKYGKEAIQDEERKIVVKESFQCCPRPKEKVSSVAVEISLCFEDAQIHTGQEITMIFWGG